MRHKPTTEGWLRGLQDAVRDDAGQTDPDEDVREPFSTVLPSSLVAQVRALAHRQSLDEGRRVTVAGIVAEALRRYLAEFRDPTKKTTA